MADCQLVTSSSWSRLPFALVFLFISIPTKCFLLYDKAKLRPIFTLLREQLLESKLDHSCHNAISLCITIACHQLQQSLLCQWKGCRRLRFNRMKWSIYSSGTMENVARHAFIFLRIPENHLLHKGIHVLCVNVWGVWWDVLIPHFTTFKSTYLYFQRCYSRSLSFNSRRASFLSVIHFIIMENPLRIWVYIITSLLCTSDCCRHYDCAKNPFISDMSNVCCNRKSREQRNIALNTTSHSAIANNYWSTGYNGHMQGLNVLLHVDSAPPTYCHHYENKIERLSLVQWCELWPSNKPQRICLAGLLKSVAVYIDWSWCPWGSQTV